MKKTNEGNKSILVAALGTAAHFPGRNDSEIGDIISVKIESSAAKTNMGKAFNEAGNAVGVIIIEKKHLGSAPELDDVLVLQEAVPMIDAESEGILVGKVPVKLQGNTSSESEAFIIELPLKGQVLEAVKAKKYPSKQKETIVNCLIGGPKKGNDGKYKIISAIGAGEKPFVTFEVTKGTIKAFYKVDGEEIAEPIGNVIDKDLVSCISEVKSILEESTSYTAQAIGLESTYIKVSIKAVQEISGKEILAENIVSNGVLSQEELDRRLDFITSLSLDKKNIEAIFNSIVNDVNGNNARIPSGGFVFKNSNLILETIIRSINAGLNILCEGPKAAGKNTAIEDMAKLYCAPLYEIQINSQVDNETLLGTRTIKAADNSANKEKINESLRALAALMGGPEVIRGLANGDEAALQGLEMYNSFKNADFSVLIDAIKSGETEVVFEPSNLVKAMEEGAFLVLDEVNTGHPEVLAILNSVLDNRRRIDVPGYGLVKAHPRFRVFATMNKDYQGTFELNEATASRFATVVFTPVKSIVDILKGRTTVSEEILHQMDLVYKKISKGVNDCKFTGDVVNIRGFINACHQIEWNHPVKEAMLRNIADGCSDLDDRAAIREIIEMSIG